MAEFLKFLRHKKPYHNIISSDIIRIESIPIRYGLQKYTYVYVNIHIHIKNINIRIFLRHVRNFMLLIILNNLVISTMKTNSWKGM